MGVTRVKSAGEPDGQRLCQVGDWRDGCRVGGTDLHLVVAHIVPLEALRLFLRVVPSLLLLHNDLHYLRSVGPRRV